MTQKMKGIDNIRKAMKRRVEEREDVMRAEAAQAQESQARTTTKEDGSIS
ncbi:MAG: hypothetical protein K6E38_06575 [Fretibacterium sp.]|nr:hypothetical protein [Fretibacterium sp.]